MIAYLWAQDEQGVIGNKGTLPWSLPNDLKYFKRMTTGNAVVMGRKTFEGMGKRPLPNRINIILTTDPSYESEGVTIMHSREEILDFAKSYEKDTFITGGTGVFKEFLEDADILYRTMIQGEFEGDTIFPALNWEEWQITDAEPGIIDEKNRYPHIFETYQRKN
ncbi:dihydrofolate reductase [Carnobacterium gallinarum]|uniref:dihydrofolate reductase n=1 Tax=Carnobacterium gallinarum TaxID=2749 RepID=UPI0005541CCE|nr:dihydrofolate reductase [Carnobacterium gallinarum]